MMTRRFWTLVGSLLIALVALAGLAHAKMIPYIEPLDADWGGVDAPFVIEQGQFLANMFGRLDEADDVDVLALTFDAPADQMHNTMLVPVCGDHFADFYPTVAIIGPGLDRPAADTLADLPFKLPDGAGALIFPYARPELDLLASYPIGASRPVAGWNLYSTGHYVEHTFAVDIPQAGEYLIAIWSPDGETGAYTLMTGAVHPDPDVFPPDLDLDATFQMIDDGAWIGWDCDATAKRSAK